MISSILKYLSTPRFWKIFTISLTLVQFLVRKLLKQLFYIEHRNMDGGDKIFIREVTKKERQFHLFKLKMVLVLEDSLRLSGKINTLQLILLIAIHSCSILQIKESLTVYFLKMQYSWVQNMDLALVMKSWT